MNLTHSLCTAITVVGLSLAAGPIFGQSTTEINVNADKPGIRISPTFFGLMTEEINHSYDGGLYGELIQNRSFRDRTDSAPHWAVWSSGDGSGAIKLESESAERSPLGVCLHLDVANAGVSSPVGIENDGYWGIPVKPHSTYRCSFYAKSLSEVPLIVEIRSLDGAAVLASAKSQKLSVLWRKYTLNLHTGSIQPTTNARFVISTKSPGSIWFKDVSLFQPTFRNRPNGNRIDLMSMMGDLNPSFLRLPGGNYLEGNTIPERFNWKETIGDIEDRPGHRGPWGYRSSDGLGLLEFLEWCEDLKMQPLLAVYAGYSLGQQHVQPGSALEPYVQDAIDEIEYVTGSTKTKWGAVRAKNGHPKPFPLTFVEVGNEDAFDRSRSYDGRFAQIYDAIKAKWPKLQIIATMPVRSRTADVIDDHYYRSWVEMARDSGHYDHYSRKGPKIFVGEWASIGGNPTPTFREALGDAAWLTGLERNSDLVVMEAYAPLMVNVNPGGSQWPTNLIGYDGMSSFGSPSYYVQSLFGKNTGDTVLPVGIENPDQRPEPMPTPAGAVGVGTYRTDAEFKDAEVVSDGKTVFKSDFVNGMSGWKSTAGIWKVEDGALHQTSNRPDTHATAGDPSWTDYSYRVKARKRAGSEGFLILFHAQSNTNYLQWNVGGWENSRSAIQRHEDGNIDEIGESTSTTVETGRWYDVRIDVHGADIKCYLDGKLVTEAKVKPIPPIPALYVAASSKLADGTVYLKVVNVSKNPIPANVNLLGLRATNVSVSAWELAGPLETANTVKNPRGVAPRKLAIEAEGPRISHAFPAYSVTVLKIDAMH